MTHKPSDYFPTPSEGDEHDESALREQETLQERNVFARRWYAAAHNNMARWAGFENMANNQPGLASISSHRPKAKKPTFDLDFEALLASINSQSANTASNTEAPPDDTDEKVPGVSNRKRSRLRKKKKKALEKLKAAPRQASRKEQKRQKKAAAANADKPHRYFRTYTGDLYSFYDIASFSKEQPAVLDHALEPVIEGYMDVYNITAEEARNRIIALHLELGMLIPESHMAMVSLIDNTTENSAEVIFRDEEYLEYIRRNNLPQRFLNTFIPKGVQVRVRDYVDDLKAHKPADVDEDSDEEGEEANNEAPEEQTAEQKAIEINTRLFNYAYIVLQTFSCLGNEGIRDAIPVEFPADLKSVAGSKRFTKPQVYEVRFPEYLHPFVQLSQTIGMRGGEEREESSPKTCYTPEQLLDLCDKTGKFLLIAKVRNRIRKRLELASFPQKELPGVPILELVDGFKMLHALSAFHVKKAMTHGFLKEETVCQRLQYLKTLMPETIDGIVFGNPVDAN